MHEPTTSVRLHVADSGDTLTITPKQLVVAGYTARDADAVAEHIAELAAIGVPAPDTVPTFYDLDPALITTESALSVTGPSTSGEAEPVVIRHNGHFYLAIGSDHTDRALERADIAKAKAACPKPLGESVIDLGTDLSIPDWDSVEMDSSVDGQPYQRGSLSALRHPSEIVDLMPAALRDGTGDLVLFCGTLPLIGGAFIHGSAWQVRLGLPDGRTLRHTYETS
ncbi:uncharacterized protein DUF2848 [Tamaricihabitans halophyticus]|uniref:Uncharacterized protein DUF2848 n=1 Tax=Tamaricihabitans halophyticus TaxID=1262583 RepID=A0A4R2QQ36_9PSEU|nr:DUF2848 family protein [Tamaricihabitans halophyticus]TCP51843.1 uncharacterized protein DUF2848 [Tamaricihabitans halophyticus]